MGKFKIITINQLLELLKGFNHDELHVHHTWKPNHSHFNGKNHLELQEGMRDFHVNTKKWSDIGQHATLMPDGMFVTGRDFGTDPASIIGYNGGLPFAVEMLGNFDLGHDKLEGRQLDSILQLAKFFDDQGRYIRFHREHASKTCPGSGIDKQWLMDQVKTYRKADQIPEASINLDGKLLSQKGLIIDGTTYLPVRAIAEALGLTVGWDGPTKTVYLKKR
jgi:hypothetical protein